MGKYAVLLVLIGLFGWTLNHAVQRRNLLESEDEQALYQEKVLAREQAMSGFGMAVSGAEKDFDNYSPASGTNAYRDGSFSIAAVGTSGDTVTVLATGTVGRAAYTIVGDLVEEGSGPLSALNIEGDVGVSLGNGNSFLITGYDTDPGGEVGSGSQSPTYGINTVDQSAMESLQAGLDSDQVTGKGGENSFSNEFTLDLDQLSNDIAVHPLCTAYPERCLTFNGNQRFTGNTTFGSQEAPVIMTVNGDCEFKGNVTGYGILRINGQFATVTGTPRWEGLVFATANGGLHELRGNPTVYGALILQSKADGEETAAPLDFAIRGNAALYYSSETLNRIPVLPSLQTNGPSEIKLQGIRQASTESAAYSTLQSH